MKYSCFLISLLFLAFQSIASAKGRYFTYIDDNGDIRNVTVDFSRVKMLNEYASLENRKRLVLSDFTEENKKLSTLIASKAPLNPDETRKRYFTWVDPTGRVQNSFYADKSDLQEKGRDFVLPTGDLASDFISSDVFEGQATQQDEDSYYTWVDASGRMYNTYLTPQERSSVFRQKNESSDTEYSDGNEIILNRYSVEELTAGIDASGKPIKLGKALSQVMKPTSTDQSTLTEKERALAKAMVLNCCVGISNFVDIVADTPKFDEINEFSPKFNFPTGESYYAAFKLPMSQRTYGLRIRSFSDKKLFYPSLLFLDAQKKPTRLVTHAIYQLYPESWHSHAYIEGVVKIKSYERERYVILFTTPDDLDEETLDQQPFPLNVSVKDKNEDFKVHTHTRTGSFELAIVR